jgi:hypothetical protein
MNALDHDLRTAAVHESAHYIIAKHFGVRARVSLVPRMNPQPGDKLVAGRLWFTTPVIGKQAQAAQIALAGALAEALLADDDLDLLYSPGWIEGLSPTDAAFAGEWTHTSASACLELLRKRWPAVLKQADYQVRAYHKRYPCFSN